MLRNVFVYGRDFLSHRSFNQFSLQKREITFLFRMINWVFNRIDYSRVKKVGPDLACAEWLLINEAGVRFANQKSFITDYNELMALEETPESAHFNIEEIYAKEASISPLGFDYLEGCNHIKKITFIFCPFLSNDAILKLKYVSNSLRYLEIRACFEVTDKGILSLTELRNLDELILVNLIYLKRKDECEAALRKALPNTKIEFRPDP